MTDPINDADTSTNAVLRLPLKALGLRAGMALQTRRLADGASKIEAQFFGAIAGKGVMVGPAGADATQTQMAQGEVCVVRGFTGQHEFSFVSKVLQTFDKPFAYALLAYPALVDAKQVRQSMRTKVSWPARVCLEGSINKRDVILVDLSPQGAMVRCPHPLGSVGDTLKISLEGRFEGTPLSLDLTATLCHHSAPPELESYIAGMAFKNLSREDKLALHYLTQSASASPV